MKSCISLYELSAFYLIAAVALLHFYISKCTLFLMKVGVSIVLWRCRLGILKPLAGWFISARVKLLLFWLIGVGMSEDEEGYGVVAGSISYNIY